MHWLCPHSSGYNQCCYLKLEKFNPDKLNRGWKHESANTWLDSSFVKNKLRKYELNRGTIAIGQYENL
jgi:hypothetical protein